MGTFSERLISSEIVGLDTSVFIYHLESAEKFRSLTLQLFSTIERGDCKAVTSVLTLLELNVRPYQLHQAEVAYHYEVVLANFPNLQIMNIDREVSRKASQLRATYNIRTPDAIQVATSMLNGARLFLTNDKEMMKLKKEIGIGLLDDLV